MLVKVCGILDSDNCLQLQTLPIDYLGINFVPTSKRYVGAAKIFESTATPFWGVFQDEAIENLVALVHAWNLQGVQLHGAENLTYCKKIKELLPDLQIIKAIPGTTDAITRWSEAKGHVDILLLDSLKGGGSGEKFTWDSIPSGYTEMPLFIAGGVSPQDVLALKALAKRVPAVAGVDINSKFEVQVGVKDIVMIKRFVEELQSHE